MLDKLRYLKIPEIYSRKYQSEVVAQALLADNFDKNLLSSEIVAVLLSEEMKELVKTGQLTLAMIKPRLHESIDSQAVGGKIDVDDAALAEMLIQSITAPLLCVFSVSITMDEKMVDEWYAGPPRENQMQLEPINPRRYGKDFKNRWDEFVSLMIGGPVTFLLLYSEDGNAVARWREQMGNHWKMEKVKQQYPDSLRAIYGTDDHNNLLHGSDSSANVQREIELLARFLHK